MFRVGFQVPQGLEDVAQQEIFEKLSKCDFYNQQSCQPSIFPGYIVLSFPIVKNIFEYQNLWQYLLNVPLFSVEQFFLLIDILPFPKATFKDESKCLINEFGETEFSWVWWIQNCLSQKAHQNWKEACMFLKLSNFYDNNAEDITEADLSPSDTLYKFRATFNRGSFKHPKINSQKMAGALGASVLSVAPKAKVNLTEFDVEVLGFLVNSLEVPDFGNLVIGLRSVKLSKIYESLHHRHRVELGRTSLRPSVAYCLCRLADIRPYQIVMDPCCGVGTICIEASLSCQPQAYFFSGDLEPANIFEKSHKNISALGLTNIELFLWDSKKIPLKDALVDTVITDLPWGMREGNSNMCARLYPKLMKQLARVVKMGGKAFILTLESKLLKRTLDLPWCDRQWEISSTRKVVIGFTVTLFCLTRLDKQ